ncbi:S9 family peptidase [Oscillatoria amoena NRMC-F 0135]|nr:S9 family peptidase [Oscillatoria amoena NRMC-F 0135]
MKRTLIIFILLPLLALGQAKKPIVASDLTKIATANQIDVAADGSKAIMVVTRKAVKNDNDYYYTRHLYLVDLTGKQEFRQLTFGDKNDSQPTLSPDGKHVAFVRTDGEKSQIWILPLTGGEAFALTKAEHGASGPSWSPDGRKILFTSAIPSYAIEGDITWKDERPGRAPGDEPNFKGLKPEEQKLVKSSPDGSLDEVRAWLAKNASVNNPKVLTRQDFQGELYLQPVRNFTHIFVQEMNPDSKAEQLTRGFQSFGSPSWSPDGKKVICSSRVYRVDPDREPDSDLWLVDVAVKTATEFVAWENHSLSNPQYSPDGTQIVFITTNTQNRHAMQSQLAVVPASGDKPTHLTATLDRDAGLFRWSADSKAIYFTAQTEGDIVLYNVPAKGGIVTKIIGNDSGVNDFDLAGDKLVYALTETKNPWEVFLYNAKDKSNKQLTRLNEDWIKDKLIVYPKEYWLTRPNGTRIQYWVMEPAGRKDGLTYPTILNIHGGPAAMWGPGVFSMWHEYQLETSWGYGVVYCNPRGSGGYGDKFKKANYRDWGTGPAGEILASLDEAIKSHSWINKDNLFVEGGSYAGYMVAWIIGHDNRFKAANAQRGVYELTTFMGEGNAWRLIPTAFGYPWEDGVKKILDDNSPMSYVDKINTPLLIIHGDQDLRTGVSQSEMLYKSLKILNKPVEYIRYPKEGHELTRSGNPGRMMDHLLRVIEFFERYAKHPEPPLATQPSATR